MECLALALFYPNKTCLVHSSFSLDWFDLWRDLGRVRLPRAQMAAQPPAAADVPQWMTTEKEDLFGGDEEAVAKGDAAIERPSREGLRERGARLPPHTHATTAP